MKNKQSYLLQPNLLDPHSAHSCLKVRYSGKASTIAATISAVILIATAQWRCTSLQQRHYVVTKSITTPMAAARALGSPLYRTFQVDKLSKRKYNILLNYFVVLNVWHGFVFCKIPISIPLNIETSIHRYFARRYSVRCWYRVPVYSPRCEHLFFANVYLTDYALKGPYIWGPNLHLQGIITWILEKVLQVTQIFWSWILNVSKWFSS